MRKPDVAHAKTKAQISFAVTEPLNTVKRGYSYKCEMIQCLTLAVISCKIY